MNKEIWEIWLEDENRRKSDFSNYLKFKKIKIEEEKDELVKGHLQKADHNLKFVKSTLDLKEFNDWAIVSSYYAIYHASLSLCALKGYSTKDHNATLLILIKEFYGKKISYEDIKMVSTSAIEKEDILYYVDARTERKKASYSTKMIFEQNEAEILGLKAINFVNKVKEIIHNL